MNLINSLVKKFSIAFFGNYMLDCYKSKSDSSKKETYVLESVFPDKSTMEKAIQSLQKHDA